ncbi:MAG: BrnA antitoxin family protein [Pseudomonadota bacterium]|nr:BrnA antitoxin family protein [Pseudomonadota bacterium]
MRARVGKQRVTIMLDAPVVAHFKALAGERGYQTLMNEALRETVRNQQMEEVLRRVIREELAAR